MDTYDHPWSPNYDEPQVQEAMLDVVRFWLDFGLDGLRLDEVPYLFEREGTNCENLPESHEFLRRVRATVDAEYPDRVLLAEANQWPGDVVEYFGDGDECHMAFTSRSCRACSWRCATRRPRRSSRRSRTRRASRRIASG